MPYKKLTKKIKDQNGNYERVAIRVMEITLRKAYQLFVQEYPAVKICRRQFETLRPKNIRLKSNAYLQLLIVNRKDALLPNNDQLISTILCDPNSLKCVFGLCSESKLFFNFDKLEIPSLKCSTSCFMKNEKCSEEGHTVKIQQFESLKYIHHGKEKKKIQLIDKHLKLTKLCELFKDKLKNLPRYRYIVAHTAKTYDQLIENLTENIILKIHDFSETYTSLVPHEIQSLHWTQEQATVYSVVVLRRVNDVIRQDHITFISSDLKHHVPFVDLLHEYYKSEGYNITHDIEYNDGCSSQFKCIKAFSSLARRNIKTTRIFCETIHGKSKSDGLGGVIKSFVYRDVCSSEKII